jgi:hypothetical protein
MLTQKELVGLYRELRAEKVLSVYLNGEGRDPAQRNVWRRRFEQQVAEVREPLKDAPPEERDEFDRALEKLESQLRSFDAFLPKRGWVGFATSHRLWNAESIPATLPDLVRWENGVRVAPYLRALKQDRDVVAVILDSRRARIFRFKQGELTEVADYRADTFLGDLSDTSAAKRATTSSGMRGLAATDAAQRLLEVGQERMIKEIAEVASDLAGQEGLVVVGGTQETVPAAVQELPKALSNRVLERSSMYIDMSPTEVKNACREAASILRKAQQKALLDEVIDSARAGGRGSLGLENTLKALEGRRVDTLLLSRSFILGDPDQADHLVGAAFEQQADVEELSDEGGDRLQKEGGGVAARLRYTIPGPRSEE